MREVFINILNDMPVGARIYATLDAVKKCAPELLVFSKPKQALRSFPKDFSSIFSFCYCFHK